MKQVSRCRRLNRTNVELKHCLHILGPCALERLNRTNVELKPPCAHRRRSNDECLNRTNVELKPMFMACVPPITPALESNQCGIETFVFGKAHNQVSGLNRTNVELKRG